MRPDPTPAPRTDRARIRRAARKRRRFEAAEVRRFTKRSRRRRWLVAGAAAFLVVSVVAPVLLAVSPLFAVRTVMVQGASAEVAAAVRARLADQIGVPIALIDERAVTRGVSAVARVQSFTTVRLPPDTLEVRVVERTAVAQVRESNGYHLVDPAEVTLAVAAKRFSGYPLVRVPATARDRAAAFSAASDVLRALPADLSPTVTTVIAGSRDDVTLTLRGGRRVVWGSAEASAAKAEALRAALVRAAKGVRRIDVSSPGVVATR